MGLDRNELAARFAVAAASSDIHTAHLQGDERNIAEWGFKCADAFLKYAERVDERPVAPTPTPPPRESGTGAYVPKVGDIVVWPTWRDYSEVLFIVVEMADGHGRVKALNGGYTGLCGIHEPTTARFVRKATASERAAAGLPPAPAPVAERPTHIRLLTTCAGLFAGTERDVINWHGACPLIRGAVAYGDTYLRETDWEPCPPPPPADARGEAYKALLAYAECSAVWHYAGISNDLWVSTLKRHGWDPEVTPSAGEFVKELCKRALAAARATKEA